MEFQKPLVTIELAEYIATKKYIETLENTIGDRENPYKLVIEALFEQIWSHSNNDAYNSSPPHTPNDVMNMLRHLLKQNNIEMSSDRGKISLKIIK